MSDAGGYLCLDPLSLDDGLLGEHPAQGALRVHESGVPVDEDLRDALRMEHTVEDDTGRSASFGDRLLAIIRRGAGQNTKYFGHGWYWLADRLAELDVSWMEECDTAGSVRAYRKKGDLVDSHYVVVRRSLEPEKPSGTGCWRWTGTGRPGKSTQRRESPRWPCLCLRTTTIGC